uniref:Uncharacterized protein n=1 Tax=viral metagenome TaxID=1070528 RepID=A0A6C0E8D2_9ZZZZ
MPFIGTYNGAMKILSAIGKGTPPYPANENCNKNDR